ncbi:MAG: AAA family ATPase [Thermoanaerobaculia bacterium]|nr:AAA family ATPase [Thermoanaerobaculia bacterium]
MKVAHPDSTGARDDWHGDELATYLPRLLSSEQVRRETVADFWSYELRGVTLLADISGFTALTESFADRGAAGAEALAERLDQSFGPMVDVIEAYGGDILRFAGDAPIVVWTVADEEPDEALALRVLDATHCAAALQRALADLRLQGSDLFMRVGIAVGPLRVASVGGIEDRWELLVAGRTLREMSEAERLAAAGEVVLSAAAGQLVGAEVETAILPGGCFLLVDRRFLEGAVAGSVGGRSVEVERAFEAKTRRESTRVQGSGGAAVAGLARFVPRSLRRRLAAGQGEWLAEYRQVTTLFASIEGIDDGASDAGEALQEAFRVVQGAVYGLGGSVNQFLVDDKGLTLVAVWGVPGHTYEDNARRGLESAMSLREELRALGLGASVGVATGRTFCGRRGSGRRGEYAVIGSSVNLAARLMTRAEGGVLCGGETRRLVGELVPFEALPPVLVKGRAEPVALYRPQGRSRGGRRASKELSPIRRLIGRDQEVGVLAAHLERLGAGQGATLILSGDVGLGKSELLEELVHRASAAGYRLVRCRGESISQEDPYSGWSQVVYANLELPEGNSAGARDERSRRVLGRLKDLEIDVATASLLNPILELDIPETELTRQLARDVRGRAIRDLLMRWLVRGLGGEPCVVVIDDVQWLDAASWALSLALREKVENLLLVVAGRREGTLERSSLEEIGAEDLQVEPLPPSAVLALARAELGVERLPRSLEDVLVERTMGNPLFVHELLESLRESGALVLEEGRARLIESADSLEAQGLPETLQGVIASRLDRLDANLQMMLKVASVVGREFAMETLFAVHPMSAERADLSQRLEELIALKVLRSVSPDPHPSFAFRSMAARDVAYELLLPAQRQQLHRGVAQWYETRSEQDVASSLLAHHWTQAGDLHKSVEYLEQAGHEAIRSGAEREAAGFFSRALTMVAPEEVDWIDPLRRVSWQRELGHAYFVLGDLGRSEASLKEALRQVGETVPDSTRGWGLRLVGETARQLLRLALASPARAGALVAPSRSREASQLMGLIGTMSFYRDEPLPFLTASLSSVNLAEKAGQPGVAGAGYAALAYLGALLGLGRLSRRWWRRCDESQDSRARANGMIGRALFSFGRCQWEACKAEIEEALDLSRRTADAFSLESALALLVFHQHYRGQFEESLTTGKALLQSAIERKSEQREMWGRLAMVGDLLVLERLGEADEQLVEAEEVLGEADELSAMTFHALRVRRSLVRENWEELAAEIDTLKRRVDRVSPLSYAGTPVFSALGEGAVSLWQRAAVDGGEATTHRKTALMAVRLLRRAARTFPFARPHLRAMEAQIREVEGPEGSVSRAWQRALNEAGQYGMPLFEAKAHRRLARWSGSEGVRKEHELEAHRLFASLGCPASLGRSAGEEPRIH